MPETVESQMKIATVSILDNPDSSYEDVIAFRASAIKNGDEPKHALNEPGSYL